MKIMKMGLVTGVLLLVAGCGAEVSQPLSSNEIFVEEFPSYKVDQPINGQVEVVVPIGKGKMEKVVELRVDSADSGTQISTLTTTTYWDIDSGQGQISTKLHTISNVSKPGEPDLEFDVEEELLSDTAGEVIDYHVDLKELESSFSPDIIELLSQVQPQWITQEYHLDELGTKITTGYEIRPTILPKEQLKRFLGVEMFSKLDQPEIVQGYGTYQNTKVVITNYNVDEVIPVIPDGSQTVAIKGRGYNLYDARSFVHIRGEFLIRMDVANEDEKVRDMEVRIRQRCDDYHVRGLITAP